MSDDDVLRTYVVQRSNARRSNRRIVVTGLPAGTIRIWRYPPPPPILKNSIGRLYSFPFLRIALIFGGGGGGNIETLFSLLLIRSIPIARQTSPPLPPVIASRDRTEQRQKDESTDPLQRQRGERLYYVTASIGWSFLREGGALLFIP